MFCGGTYVASEVQMMGTASQCIKTDVEVLQTQWSPQGVKRIWSSASQKGFTKHHTSLEVVRTALKMQEFDIQKQNVSMILCFLLLSY